MDIMAVRYEKVQEDEVVWDTDYIMNFHDMKLAVTLERSYKAETVITNAGFSTPHFISILINAGVLANDNGLDVMNTPLEINSGNTDIIADMLTGKSLIPCWLYMCLRLRKSSLVLILKLILSMFGGWQAGLRELRMFLLRQMIFMKN